MGVSPATAIEAGHQYRYKSTYIITNTNCKYFYIPKSYYKKSLEKIKQKKSTGHITNYLIIPLPNYDGAHAIINYFTI